MPASYDNDDDDLDDNDLVDVVGGTRAAAAAKLSKERPPKRICLVEVCSDLAGVRGGLAAGLDRVEHNDL